MVLGYVLTCAYDTALFQQHYPPRLNEITCLESVEIDIAGDFSLLIEFVDSSPHLGNCMYVRNVIDQYQSFVFTYAERFIFNILGSFDVTQFT